MTSTVLIILLVIGVTYSRFVPNFAGELGNDLHVSIDQCADNMAVDMCSQFRSLRYCRYEDVRLNCRKSCGNCWYVLVYYIMYAEINYNDCGGAQAC